MKPQTVFELDLTPAKRCPDYDAECADVTSHAHCWSGIDRDGVRMMAQAEGYCPYLVGEVKRGGGTGCG